MRMGLAFAIGGALLVGCGGGHFPRPPYSAQPTSALVELREPPPPARVEAIPVRPKSLAVWIDGEWSWRRARWAWVPGRWVVPRDGETFSPWVVVRGSDGKLWLATGTWRDAKGNAVEGPAPLALAVVDSGQVVNASGTIEPTSRTLKVTERRPAVAPK
jgi:WXXGXW repeat (2 copies)